MICILITLILCCFIVPVVCAAMVVTGYDKTVDDEKQEEYIKKIRN